MNEMSCQGSGPHANTKNAEHLLPELTGVDSTLFAKMCCTNQNGLNLSCIPIPAMVGKCGSLRDSSKDWHRKICCQRCWTYSPVLISRSMVVVNPVLAAIKGGKKNMSACSFCLVSLVRRYGSSFHIKHNYSLFLQSASLPVINLSTSTVFKPWSLTARSQNSQVEA